MKKKLAVVALSLITALSGIAPAQAFPTVGAPKIEAPQAIQTVQWSENALSPRLESRRYWRYRDGGPRRYYRDRYYRDSYYRDRYYRRHRDSNVGAIIGGLAAGAIIGGALAQPRYVTPRRYVGGNAHVNWCYSRYRSYRAYDNTYQPYGGPRRQCYSPYS